MGRRCTSACSVGRRLDREPACWIADAALAAFARIAADHGARVAGIDAAEGLIAIAAERTPSGDFRVRDLEALPWPDESFDVVTGFNAFQFADDKARALAEARRVSHGPVAVVIPTRASESAIALVFKPLFPLFSARGTGEHEAERHLRPIGTGEA